MINILKFLILNTLLEDFTFVKNKKRKHKKRSNAADRDRTSRTNSSQRRVIDDSTNVTDMEFVNEQSIVSEVTPSEIKINKKLKLIMVDNRHVNAINLRSI